MQAVNFSKFLKTPSITEHLRWLLLITPVNQPIFRGELIDLQLYYSRTFSQELFYRKFSNMCFKHFNARKYYYGRTSANENVKKMACVSIVTRNNIVWKLAHSYCLCYCKTFSLVPDSTECTNFFYRSLQYIICTT